MLIIFDCDGVLVDSEGLANQALVDYLTELQIQIPFSEALRLFTGRRMKECLQEIEKISGQVLPENFETHFRQRMDLAFEKSLKAISGIEDALKNIPYPKCVASNAPLQKINKNLTLTDLHKYFDGNIFSSYTIQKWKPEPDLFLHACQTMGAQPHESVVIEDSALGVEAARRAGMRVLHFTHSEDPLPGFRKLTSETWPDYRAFGNMFDLPGLVSETTKNNPKGPPIRTY